MPIWWPQLVSWCRHVVIVLVFVMVVAVACCCVCPRVSRIVFFLFQNICCPAQKPGVQPFCFKAPPWASPFERSFQKQALNAWASLNSFKQTVFKDAHQMPLGRKQGCVSVWECLTPRSQTPGLETAPNNTYRLLNTWLLKLLPKRLRSRRLTRALFS